MTAPIAGPRIAARRAGGVRRALDDLALITGRNLRRARRSPAVIVAGTAFPIFLMLVFVAQLGPVVTGGGSYAEYAQFLTPLIVVFGLQFASLNSGVTMFRDVETGLVARWRTMPISPPAILAGRVLGDQARAAVQAVIIVAVGAVIGFRFEQGLLWALPFLALAVAFNAAFALLAVAISLRAASAEIIQTALSPFYLPLGFLSTGYVPADGFPGWIQPVVRNNPVSIVVDSLRAMSTGGPLARPLLPAMLWTAGLLAVFGGWAIANFRRLAA